MGYEDATATKIMATHCCACGKPLVDSVSVQTGMGPICRKKYGFDVEVPPRVRALANKIVYRLACDVSHNTVTMESMEASSNLRALGFPKIANIFEARMVRIAIHVDGFDGQESYYLRAPYDETGAFNHSAWAPGRKPTKCAGFHTPTAKKTFHWTYPKNEESRKRIFDALVKHYNGHLAFAPDGSVFEIKPLKTAAQKAAEAAKNAA